MIGKTPRIVGSAGLALAILVLGTLSGRAQSQPTQDPWPELARDIFKDRVLLDGSGVIALDLPYRAEDAAVVPLSVRSTMAPGDTRHIQALTIVIDENPSPVAAVFNFGPKAGVNSISTRVRVDSYTNVHAVAELSDGRLYMVKTYVKAAGGCSAPAIKDVSAAKVHVGEIRFRQFAPSDHQSTSAPRQAQIMIRHPNNSGMQMDQVTHLYIPPFFIDEMKIWQGNELVMAMNGGISISENPSIRFSYLPNGAATFRAEAVDTDKHVYKGEWAAQASAM
jgi:sulfur-oxidizing protein SoxY